MQLTDEQYRDLLLSMAPPGLALPDDPDSDWGRLWEAQAQELARLAQRDEDLDDEADPRTATELLPDWERVLGLPDTCSGEASTLAERRAAVVSKLLAAGGQTPEYFRQVAKAFAGQAADSADVREFRPFKAGSKAGDQLTNGDWINTMRIVGPWAAPIRFKAGRSRAGDPLATWPDAQVRCLIGRLAPAHVLVQFEEA